MILEVTARTYSGYCGTCHRKPRGSWGLLGRIAFGAGFVTAALSSFACGLIESARSIRRFFRRLRFPYDISALRKAILVFHPPGLTAAYINGIIDGYFENYPWAGMFYKNAMMEGRFDGGLLRRGEIEISAIPSCRGKFVIYERRWFSSKQTSYDTPWQIK